MLYLKLAWRNIWRNRRRTFITMASIVMAVFLSTVLWSMQMGQYDQILDNTVGMFAGHMQIQHELFKEEPTLDNSFESDAAFLDELGEIEGIRGVIPRLDSYALAAGEQRTRAAMVIGVDVDREKLLSRPQEKITEGAYFTDNAENGVLLSAGLADFLKLAVGDTMVLLGQGFRGISAAGAYEIKGIMRFGIPDLNNALVYLPIETAREYFGAPDRVTSISIQVHQPKKLQESLQIVESQLGPETVVLDWQTLMPEIVQAIQADYGSSFVVMMILYMVVGFGILGTVLMMTSERKYEFGVMIAVGTSRLRMASILIFEMLFMAMMGTLVGVLLSLPIVFYYHNYPLEFFGDAAQTIQEFGMEPFLQFSVAANVFTLPAIIVLGMTLVISTYPVWHVYRLKPVKAMRH